MQRIVVAHSLKSSTMKLTLIFLALVAVAASKSINSGDVVDLEENTAYGYITKIGQPLAKQIFEAESRLAAGESRITGGQHAFLGQFPYQAGLVINYSLGQSVCGGAIIGPLRVLTAAHCWFDGWTQALSFTVVTGSITVFSGGNRQTTSSVVLHENWTPSLIRNDIAMINLLQALVFSNTIAPIALPYGSQVNEDFAGSPAIASGFGRTGDGPDGGLTTNQALSWVEVPVISNSQCATSYPAFVQNSNICTSGAGGRNVCSSDSGGPLAVNRNGPLLVGIVSFGSATGCQAGHPSAYARVTYYLPWIINYL